jgi:hypothetical protein
MNGKFKPLGLAAAVAAASAGFSSVATAQTSAGNDLGDLALIPYYSVRDGYVTGVHITNTSNLTQVVKVRMRRGVDSMDALDFNLVLSPKDVWTGFITEEGEDIVFNTTDNSCTAPEATDGKFVMPTFAGSYREGAEEGYIEIIGMGSASPSQPISVSAEHDSDGVPANCDYVRDNFFADGVSGTTVGAIDGLTSAQRSNPDGASIVDNVYGDTGDVLKVSFFLRDSAGGVEFGNSATHIAGFLTQPAITNQQRGLFSGDLLGFDYPDLNGGIPVVGERGRFVNLRTNLGTASVINDWSANTDLNVGTDWVITFPGQYTMLDLPHYFASLATAGAEDEDDRIPCNGGSPLAAGSFTGVDGACDHRDIPAIASFDVYDREEQQKAQPQGGLVVSPALPGEVVQTELPYEVNVVQWGPDAVLGSENSDITVEVPDSAFGWAELMVTSNAATTQAVCQATADNSGVNIGEGTDAIIAAVTAYGCSAAGVNANEIPKIGFVAWQRNFPGNEAANYGRIVEHSYNIVSSAD